MPSLFIKINVGTSASVRVSFGSFLPLLRVGVWQTEYRPSMAAPPAVDM
jgi:hypothetical protein